MSLIRYQPSNLLAQFNDEINRLFDARNNPVSEWSPAVDVKETDKEYVIHADVPGVEAKDIDVTLEDGVLTIRGERNWSNEQENESYKRVERAYGSFFRRFSLPDTADAESVKAKSNNGVLEIVIPKQEKALPRKITVNS
ncbi:MAG: Hsp20/alpha crystallin family protein [Gammaproteobacteria bacterium]|nr:Hsp20/alpha crystallin family protein [Gammaproteobacteria bacterium]